MRLKLGSETHKSDDGGIWSSDETIQCHRYLHHHQEEQLSNSRMLTNKNLSRSQEHLDSSRETDSVSGLHSHWRHSPPLFSRRHKTKTYKSCWDRRSIENQDSPTDVFSPQLNSSWESVFDLCPKGDYNNHTYIPAGSPEFEIVKRQFHSTKKVNNYNENDSGSTLESSSHRVQQPQTSTPRRNQLHVRFQVTETGSDEHLPRKKVFVTKNGFHVLPPIRNTSTSRHFTI